MAGSSFLSEDFEFFFSRAGENSVTVSMELEHTSYHDEHPRGTTYSPITNKTKAQKKITRAGTNHQW